MLCCRCTLSFAATSEGLSSLQNHCPMPKGWSYLCCCLWCVLAGEQWFPSQDSQQVTWQNTFWTKPGCGLERCHTQRQLCLLYPTDVTTCKKNSSALMLLSTGNLGSDLLNLHHSHTAMSVKRQEICILGNIGAAAVGDSLVHKVTARVSTNYSWRC